MRPAEPGRFSTLTGCPRARASLSETARATMSPTPPGGNATTSCTGLVGQVCADAGGAIAIATTPDSRSAAARHGEELVMVSSVLMDPARPGSRRGQEG